MRGDANPRAYRRRQGAALSGRSQNRLHRRRRARGIAVQMRTLPGGELYPSRRRTVMSIENTDLERRVLAHEQILQVLIAHLAEAEPKFLDRLQEIFTKHHTLGANEQDYTDTAAYAEQFIHQVVRMRDRERRG